MTTVPVSRSPLPSSSSPDLAAIKTRQQGAWSSGDYAIVGTTLQIVGETLCETLDLRAGQRVLDVAAGNGNASLAAARRWCDVVATDYVPALLDRAGERAQAEGLEIAFRVADAEALPFDDATFDAVVSTFGVMFTPDQERAAAELIRVCKHRGRIGMANWTPEGFIGQVFKTIGQHGMEQDACKNKHIIGTGRDPHLDQHNLNSFPFTASLQMIVQILTDAGQVRLYGDAELFQVIGRTDAR